MRHFVVPAVAVIVLALAGCTPADDSTVSSDPPAFTSPLRSADPGTSAPTTGSAVESPNCSNALTDAEYASLDADGLTLNPDVFVLDDTMQSLVDDNGLACYWTRASGDVRVWYAQTARTSTEWDAQRQGLIDAGWTETDSPSEGVIQSSTDNDDDYVPAMTYRDGVVYYASYSGFLGSVKALQG